VVGRCLKIRKLVDQGAGLVDIKRILGTDWAEEASRYVPQYLLSESQAELDFTEAVMEFDGMLVDRIANHPFAPKDWWTFNPKFFEFVRTQIKTALELVADGINPVIVIDQGKFFFTPDFMVSDLLARSLNGPPIFVMSVFSIVVKAFAKAAPNLPQRPDVVPVRRVRCAAGKRTRELDFHPVGDHDFQISKK